jgi:hypothetical protein
MALAGKGFFIWKVPNAENGNASSIANQAQSANYTHVLLKIADGTNLSNYDSTKNIDYLPAVVSALKAKGIAVWGWHYVYGNDPLGEAQIAVQRVRDLGLAGYVIDAESQFKESGKAAAARTYLNEIKRLYSGLPLALSSYRYPSYHSTFPWSEFLPRMDMVMPQVYWEEAHNADSQLTKCVSEYRGLAGSLPIIPTGPAYKTSAWTPTQTDINKFFNTAKSLNLPAVNFFSWDECRASLASLWNFISSYNYGTALPQADIPVQYISAMNSRDIPALMSLYNTNAVQITASRTLQGTAALKDWFTRLVSEVLPSATFTITGLSGTGNNRTFTWKCSSSRGSVQNGSDTFGLINGKISYHYSFYTIS